MGGLFLIGTGFQLGKIKRVLWIDDDDVHTTITEVNATE